jgi:glycosyltransferase involved in cell wall biosynthesis
VSGLPQPRQRLPPPSKDLPGPESGTVALGPSLELHDGVHGALIDEPPAGVTYVQPAWSYQCRFPQADGFPPNPFDDLSACDSVSFRLPHGGLAIHSSRLPVSGDVPWICESDCLISTLQYGMLFALGSEAAVREGAVAADRIRLRVRTMLSRFLEDGCEALLFRTEFARASAFQWIEESAVLGLGQVEKLWGKSAVVYPAVPAIRRQPLGARRSVLFAGRTFEDKGAEIALAIYRELHTRFGDTIRLIFVGNRPPGRASPDWIIFHPVMPRSQFLELLAECDILLHPSFYESLGMTLIEAAGAGLAIATSCGPGMEHIEEILVDGTNACLVPNSLPEHNRVRHYVDAISVLIKDDARLRELSTNNRRLARYGPFSIRERNRRLLPHYQRMWERLANGHSASQGWHHTSSSGNLATRTFSEAYLRLEMATRGEGRSRRLLLPAVPASGFNELPAEASATP